MSDLQSFDARFAAIEAEGRRLLTSRESRATLLDPFLLATEAHSVAVDQAVRRVTLFAFVLSAIVVGLAVTRVAPLPIAGFALVWAAAAGIARLFARRMRRELGRSIVDFEAETVEASPLDGRPLSLPLAGARVISEPSADGDAPVWVIFHAQSGVRLRLCRGEERDVDRVLAILRKHRIEVIRAHDQG
ncbi:MAG: hypothetical protein HOV80_29835 [Polyangiaceae bacterium]|nr:hypothetical protein [Polyangiaceae bacterium]